MLSHPCADARQPIHGPLVELAPGRRPDVQEQIAPFADRVNQHLHQLLHALPGRFVAVVAPGAGEGLAGFPQHPLAVHFRPFAHHDLLGCPEVPAPVSIQQIRPVVDEDVGLQLAYHLDQLLRLPVLSALAILPRIGEVEEQDVNPAEFGQEFPDLGVQVFSVLPDIPVLGLLPELRVVPHGVEAVHGELRMVPVNQRVVEADAEPFLAEGLDHGPQQLLAAGGVDRLVVGVLRVPEAEALVVLGGDDEVPHARLLRRSRPGFGVVEVGVEVIEVGLIRFVGDAFTVLHPLVSGRQGIQPPVDEHAKPVVNPPLPIAFWFPDGVHCEVLLCFLTASPLRLDQRVWCGYNECHAA